MSRRRAPSQCHGITKARKRCSITTNCNARTDSGGLACEPLNRGGRFCLFHAEIFSSRPADARGSTLFYLDFETTGLSVLQDFIVEIGLLDHQGSAVYSTVVQPPVLPGDEPTVHGIESSELAHGPSFPVAFKRMQDFLANAVDMALVEASDSSGDEFAALPALRDEPPAVLIAAHNGFRFDLPILFSECLRHGIGLFPFLESLLPSLPLRRQR